MSPGQIYRDKWPSFTLATRAIYVPSLLAKYGHRVKRIAPPDEQQPVQQPVQQRVIQIPSITLPAFKCSPRHHPKRYQPYRRFARKRQEDLNPMHTVDYGAMVALSGMTQQVVQAQEPVQTQAVANGEAAANDEPATTDVPAAIDEPAATTDDESSLNFATLGNALADVDGIDVPKRRSSMGFNVRVRFSDLVVDIALSIRRMIDRRKQAFASRSSTPTA